MLFPKYRSRREAEFQDEVLKLAELYRWACYHTAVSLGSQKGFPDLVMVKGSRCLFVELKRSNAETPTTEQARWLTLLREVSGENKHVDVYLWAPEDWDAIVSVLTA